MNKIYGRMLPSRDFEEIAMMEKQLEKRNIRYKTANGVSSKIIYFPESEIFKLPTDTKGHYIPVTKYTGFSFYEISKEYYDKYDIDWGL